MVSIKPLLSNATCTATHRQLSAAFDTWEQMVEEAQKAREEQRFLQQMNAKQARQLEKFALKLHNAMMTKAWNHWFNLFVQLRKIKTTLGRIMVGLHKLNTVDP